MTVNGAGALHHVRTDFFVGAGRCKVFGPASRHLLPTVKVAPDALQKVQLLLHADLALLNRFLHHSMLRMCRCRSNVALGCIRIGLAASRRVCFPVCGRFKLLRKV